MAESSHDTLLPYGSFINVLLKGGNWQPIARKRSETISCINFKWQDKDKAIDGERCQYRGYLKERKTRIRKM